MEMIRGVLLKIWGVLPIPFWLRQRFIWLATQKFLVGVVGLVSNEAGEILLFEHTYRRDYPWGLPGGWLKAKEDPATAIEREIREESNYQVRVIRLLAIKHSEERPWLDLIYLCEFTGGRFRASPEVSAAHFFSLDQLPELIPSQRQILVQAMKLLSDGDIRPLT
jgi:8-oxo-dGTP diphosphatase